MVLLLYQGQSNQLPLKQSPPWPLPQVCPQLTAPILLLSGPTWSACGWETSLLIAPHPPFRSVLQPSCANEACVLRFSCRSLAKKLKGMMGKKEKVKWEWERPNGMFFAVCSVFMARGFIRLSARSWARLNGHHCPALAQNLLLAPLAPLRPPPPPPPGCHVVPLPVKETH